MHIHRGYENIILERPVVTLGIFDGVHRGHRVLLDRLVSSAREAKGTSVVVTFSPHPRLVLDKESRNLTFLTTMEEKTILLARAGIDNLIIIEFNREFSMISACDFVKDVLVGKIGTRHLIIGYNHHFGRRGEGDFNTIKQCTDSIDFRVEQVEGFQTSGGAVSSSAVREALLKGNLGAANNLLGYEYQVSGSVIEGRKLGRTLGFPTANIKPADEHKLIPGKGVYAVTVDLEGKIYPGMLSIGSNPTVNPDSGLSTIEVNIINFDGDIYGKPISVVFKKRLRDEIKFESVEKLAEQMELDRQSTLRLFS